jgi:hypothetical protein
LSVAFSGFGRIRGSKMTFFDFLWHKREAIADEAIEVLEEDNTEHVPSKSDEIERCLWEIKEDLNLTTEEIETALIRKKL